MSCSGAPSLIASMRCGSAPTASASLSASVVTRARARLVGIVGHERCQQLGLPHAPHLVHRRRRNPCAASAHALSTSRFRQYLSAKNADDTEREQRQDAVEAVLLDRLRGRLAGPVGEHRDAGRPEDPTGGVPHEEPPPGHVAEPGEPRGGHAQDRDEAAEERPSWRRASAKNRSDGRQRLVRVALREAPAVDQRATAEPAESRSRCCRR